MEQIAPTRERLAHAESYEAPVRDRDVNRTAYRLHSQFETLHRRGELDDEQLKAAEKFEKCVRGAARHDVRTTDMFTESNAGVDGLDHPWVYYGQKLAEARRTLHPIEWSAILTTVEETQALEQIGQRVRQVACRKIARAQGLAVISIGLDRLCYLWGLKQRAA